MLLQVSVRPTTILPGRHERFVVRVANPADTAIVAVRVTVPDAVTILGIDAPPGWTGHLVPGAEGRPAAVEWQGGHLGRHAFREFAFLGRVPGDARRGALVFPVRLEREDGSILAWGPGGIGPPGQVQIRGSVGVTPGGAFALAAGAFGLAALAVALGLRRSR